MDIKSLYRANFQPNYPVCEGVIFFLVDEGTEITESFVELMAKDLGFNHTSPIRLVLLGAVHPKIIDFDIDNFEVSNDMPKVSIIHFENGEY